MKTTFRLLLLLLTIVFYSCDKEEIQEDDPVQSSKGFDTQNNGDEPSELETRMQWVSFLVAQTIQRNSSAKEFFLNTLANSQQTNKITLRSLLGELTYNNTFVEAFKLEFLYYANGFNCRSGDEPDGVPKPSKKPPPSSNINLEDEEDVYVYSLLNNVEEYEFELYLPNGFSNAGVNQIMSSAFYSLEVSLENAQGFIHFEHCDTHDVDVTPDYRGNLIILQYQDQD